ncbi:uncharacterized protein LOC143198411 [Rhynchophorus ferrugineus]|uniref:Zinc-finger domain-containing protein n=1 Tax=Rhynchophorus ferrugineus TaxID=354439 RepID=A0A834IHV2_RHYFE|nr:hypothetical protein GWI33_005229 [Rhynchophorus ferrugineus]
MEEFDDILSPSFSPIESPESLEKEFQPDDLSKRKTIKIKVDAMTGKSENSFLKCSSDREPELNSSGENDDNSDGHSDVGDSLEEIRRQNIEAMNALLNSIRNPELENHFKAQSRIIQQNTLKGPFKKHKKKRGNGDVAFQYRGLIPNVIRKSSRLRNKDPDYNENDLDGVHETLRSTYFKRPNYNIDDYSLEDLEDVVNKPKRKSVNKRAAESHIIIPVEDVTQAMIDKIALRVKGKVYSTEGTTCHQCRQKTLDQKTCCRSLSCVGIQGMFCGVCIKNRYGEDAAVALKDPNWICPVCRGICNCSICRTRQGKRPTGILAPICHQQGYESVSHFLKDLKGLGDKPEEDSKWLLENDDEALLGYSREGQKIHLLKSEFDNLCCITCLYGNTRDPTNLIGFSLDGKKAVMGGGKLEKNNF